MIRTQEGYERALAEIRALNESFASRRAVLEEKGFAPEEIERVIEPLKAFGEGLGEDVFWYERMLKGEFVPPNFGGLGLLLIGLRVNRKLTVKELGVLLRMGGDEVDRHERNEWFGISVQMAEKIITALGFKVQLQVS
ncbi:MAG: hypothetical protein Q7S03_03180 [bacterium]|nr:hypothetical protein [bacterium]